MGFWSTIANVVRKYVPAVQKYVPATLGNAVAAPPVKRDTRTMSPLERMVSPTPAPTIDDAAWNALRETSHQEEVRVITPPHAQPAVGHKTRLRSIERHVDPDGTEVQVISGYDGSKRTVTRRSTDQPAEAPQVIPLPAKPSGPRIAQSAPAKNSTAPPALPTDSHPLGLDWGTVDAYPSYAGYDKQVIRKHYATHMAWNAAKECYTNSYLMNFMAVRVETKHPDAPKDFETFLLDSIARELKREQAGNIHSKVLCRYTEQGAGTTAKHHVAFVTEFGTFHRDYLEGLLQDANNKNRLRCLAEGSDMSTAALTRIDLSAVR